MKSVMNKLKRKTSLNECGIEDLIGHTFIIRSSVLNTISIIIKYSNGVETTMRQILYLKLFRLLGIYRSSGRAPIVKSIHDFCAKETKKMKLRSFRFDLCIVRMDFTWFLSISPSCNSASPCSWNVIIIKATNMFTKKNGNTIK